MHRTCSITISSFVDNTMTNKTVDYCYRNFTSTSRRRCFLNISREKKSGNEIVFGTFIFNPIEQQQQQKQQQRQSHLSYSHSPSLYSNETTTTSSSKKNNQYLLGDNNNSKNLDTHYNNDDAKRSIYGTIPQYGNGIAIGQYACIERIFTIDDVTNFSILSGDTNPLHTSWKLNELPGIISNHTLLQWEEEEDNNENEDENENKKSSIINSTSTSKVLVHGMLVSSMFTCIFGTLIPGAVYMKQNIMFTKPVYVNTKVVATITINKIRSFPNSSNQQVQQKEEQKHQNGLIVSCSTIVTSSSIQYIPNDTETEETSPIIEYVKGDAIVWMTKGVKLDR